MIYVLSGGAKAAGVIRITYPANSTLVVKGTSSGKQFAKDTNTTSSTKVYIFLAPNGDASYTLTSTSTAGETVSKQVYVAKDQVQSVTLTYFSATINVTYPAKSKCVIKNSSGTQVDSDTNTGTSAKTWTATVNATGTYTVTATATDGSGKTKSTTVSITADGQVKTVTLTYELVLFNNGVVSGYAWDSLNFDSSYGDAKVSGGLIYLYGYTWDNNISLQSGWGEIGISSAINLSNYSALKVHLNKIDNAEGIAKIQVGTTALGDNTATKTVALTAGTTTSLDISSITGSKYISLYAQSNTSTYGNMIKVYFDKVWLE